MIYAYMWIQINSEPTTTNYHTFLKLEVIIYFAIVIMRARKDWRHQPPSLPQPCFCWTAAEVLVDSLLCARATCT